MGVNMYGVVRGSRCYDNVTIKLTLHTLQAGGRVRTLLKTALSMTCGLTAKLAQRKGQRQDGHDCTIASAGK
jgi:hypothetical protein